MKSYSFNYYITIWFVLFVISVSTIIKVFVDHHTLRFIFVFLFLLGLLVGYVRYLMRKKSDDLKQRSKLLRFGVLLLFILFYMAIKNGVNKFVSGELSSQDYGVALAFFFLGLFISYYGLYSIYLWNSRKKERK